jgi:hypothetical protein
MLLLIRQYVGYPSNLTDVDAWTKILIPTSAHLYIWNYIRYKQNTSFDYGDSNQTHAESNATNSFKKISELVSMQETAWWAHF